MGSINDDVALLKARVKGHTRKLKSGKRVQVKPHARRGERGAAKPKARAKPPKRRWKVLGRKRSLVGATITEAMDVNDDLYRRYTATIHGYRNWRIWEGRMGRGSGIDMPALVAVIRERVREIMVRIEAKDETVFNEPPKKFSLLTRKMKHLSE